MSVNRKVWTEEEWATLQRMRADGVSWSAIDQALGRQPKSSRSKWENERAKERIRADKAAAASKPPPAEHQSLTAAFFGDPLPGRSALDRRRIEVSSLSISASGARP
ncbi:hypothetical protein ACRQ5Q_16795 [Bradyrhizobium sp. PMVTL-01]|uniref:hypothetical protein n=1 Tax=Bradyrhizobium sp. PMVTL-01 TaxID=3434999 RepID=UPI003F6FA7B1